VLSVVSDAGDGRAGAFAGSGFQVFEPVGTIAAREIDEVLAAAAAFSATLVFVSREASLSARQLQVLGWRLDEKGIGMCVEPSTSTIRPGRTLLLPHPTTTLLLVRTVHLSLRDRFIKRTADIVISVLLIPVLFPIALVAAVFIVVEDGFPAIFRQLRLGRRGTPIRIYKLRTMYRDADRFRPDPRSRKAQVDPRCTRVGRVLRRWSIDEIPQLWCVLIGTMSLVGPRPRLESELGGSPEEFRRLEARPGLTGLWQTSGRSDLSFEEAEQLDVEYVDNWSLIGDLVILARTLRTVATGRGAY
jgi:lipopolysaccharide/colanic/teichoic acid biosynthesis glycosyltransferase